MKKWLILGVVIFSNGIAMGYNHTELEWRTIETEHFSVHFHQNERYTAQMGAEIAEEIYDPITSLYSYEPKGKVHLIFKDTDDISNGASYFYDNKIEIWATNLDWELRGTHHWLRNVITHEFTHIVSLQASFKFPRRIPGIYLQHIGYEDEKRPDVLTGYPNVLASYPLPGTIIPMWFAEGMAQFQACGLNYDTWDSHRDMLLRMATLGDNVLSYDQMGVFGKNGLNNEMVYNQGYSMVCHIARRYGEGALEELAKGMRKCWCLTFDAALKKALHKSGPELFREWRTAIEERYAEQTKEIRDNLLEGEKISDGGFMNIHPVWSPDGSKIAYLSNRGSDYQIMSLYLQGTGDEEPERLTGGVRSSICWSPDGKAILYAKRSEPNRYGSHVNDIYRYDLGEKRETRLTRGLRVKDPCLSPDGTEIVVVVNGDGTNDLVVLDPQGSPLRRLTNNDDGTQYFRPRWSPTGDRIVFSVFRGRSRDIASMASDGTDFRYLVHFETDDRDPWWTPDGDRIIFSSDREGIFNLYALSLADSSITQITNVLGGAFNPSISPDGEDILFSSYGMEGYAINRIGETSWRELAFADFAAINWGEPEEEFMPDRPSRPYRLNFSNMFFYPRLAIDDNKFKVGLYASSNEVLDKQSLFFGGLVGGRDLDFDLFAIYENRQLPFTLFVEGYSMRRHVEDTQDSVWVSMIGQPPQLMNLAFDLKYNLSEVDVGARWEWSDPYSLTYRKELTLAYIYSKYGLGLTAYNVDDGKHLGKDQWTYFRGHDLALTYRYKSIGATRDGAINPRGREFTLRYDRMFNKLSSGGVKETKYGLATVYDKNYYDQFTVDWTEYHPLPYWRHTLALRLRGGVIDRAVDDFFYFQLGSFDGLRGYSYYSIEGRRMALGQFTYRFPIFVDMNRQLLHLYLSRLYGALFFDAGKAWDISENSIGSWARDVGGEIRLEAFSFYTYPTCISFQAAYGMDHPVEKERWRYYFTLLFGFL